MTRWLSIGCGVLVTAIILILVGQAYPVVGHDYRYFVPRLIDTDLYIRLNGLSIQWFTPSFGGGLPAFPNPQHLQHSVLQLLTLVMNPWRAVLVSTAMVTAIGLAGCYGFLRSRLQLGAPAAMLGALFFIANGFSIERVIVGHLGFQLFPLMILMLWTITGRTWPVAARGALLGLLIALTLYHGGGILLVIEAMSIALCLPLLLLFRADLLEGARPWRAAAIGVVFGAAIGAPKIATAMMLMRHFPRSFLTPSHPNVIHGLSGLLSQLAGVETLAPLLMAAGVDPARAYGAMVNLTSSPELGIWELDAGFPPTFFVCLALGVWAVVRERQRQLPAVAAGGSRRVPLAALVVGIWITIEACLGTGLIFPWLQRLPIISTMHVFPRFAGAAVLPLSLAAACLVDRWIKAGREPMAAALIVLTSLSPLAYLLLPAPMLGRTFNVSQSIEDYAALRQPGNAGIDRIAAVSDAEALSLHASSLQPYDPLFGYGNELFAAKVHEGVIRETDNGRWNMTDPRSLVFRTADGGDLFERIRESDREALEAFLAHRRPDWPLPASVRWLTFVALGAVLACAATIAAGLRNPRR
jgi:hypothetical protein